MNCEIHEQCIEVIETLSEGDRGKFPEKAARLFDKIYRLVIEECRRLGYYEAAAGVYDGTALWK